MSDDRLEVERLIFRYAELMDGGDFEGLADLLSDATLGPQGASEGVHGRDAVLKLFASTVRLYEDGTPRTRHLTTNLQVEMGQDGTAKASSYFAVLQATEGLPLQPIVAGTYRDRFERRGGAWRFVERRFNTDLVGDLSRHFLHDPSQVLGNG
jgi:3-phenylpropionate/cinnamic acid dioxygenase small subunit